MMDRGESAGLEAGLETGLENGLKNISPARECRDVPFLYCRLRVIQIQQRILDNISVRLL